MMLLPKGAWDPVTHHGQKRLGETRRGPQDGFASEIGIENTPNPVPRGYLRSSSQISNKYVLAPFWCYRFYWDVWT
jgi:hypothetical protein